VIECALGLARVRYDDAVRTPGTRTCGSQARGGLCVTRDVISFRFACGDIFFFEFALRLRLGARARRRRFGKLVVTRRLRAAFFFLERGP
jgi:hypothetical protein